MNDESFAAFEAALTEKVELIGALEEENDHLRTLLSNSSESPHTPTITVSRALSQDGVMAASPKLVAGGSQATEALDAQKLMRELEESRKVQQALAIKLASLQMGPDAVVQPTSESDLGDEVALLRSSLAALASALETEKKNREDAEAARRAEEDKVNTLRSKVEESRRALMRLQGESSRRASASQQDVNNRRASAEYGSQARGGTIGGIYPPVVDTAPRRKSSLGLPPVGLGLGSFSAQGGTGEPTTPTTAARQSALSRFAHRRGSASMSHSKSDSGLDEPREDDQEFERRRFSSIGASTSQFGVISEEDQDADIPSRPPSAPLRAMGRNNSVAVFENMPRRKSSIGFLPASAASFAAALRASAGAPPARQHHSEDDRFSVSLEPSQLELIQGLRIQLAEAEEGRRASEVCLRALKEFITTNNGKSDSAGIQLPPLPTEADDYLPVPSAPRNRASMARWSIPRLPSLSAGRRESIGGSSPSMSSTTTSTSTSPNLTSLPGRSMSIRSASSAATERAEKVLPAKPSIPTFTSFSFSALVERNDVADEETSPTMTGSPTMGGNVAAQEHDSILDDYLHSDDEDGNVSDSATVPSLTSDTGSSISSRSSSPVDSEDEALSPIKRLSAEHMIKLVDGEEDPLSLDHLLGLEGNKVQPSPLSTPTAIAMAL